MRRRSALNRAKLTKGTPQYNKGPESLQSICQVIDFLTVSVRFALFHKLLALKTVNAIRKNDSTAGRI